MNGEPISSPRPAGTGAETMDKLNYKASAMRGGAWAVASQCVRFGCQIASISILARLLSPDDFGLIGLLASFTVVITAFRELGLSTAIVQTEELEQPVLCRLFVLSMALGGTMAVVISLVSCLVGLWTGDGRVLGAGVLYGIAAGLGSIEAVPLGLLRRRLAFRQITIREAVAAVVSTLVGVVAAFLGFGYWSLVAIAVCQALMTLVLSWIASGWVPSGRMARWAEVRDMLKFGGGYSLSNLATVLSRNLDQLLIGRFCGLTELGYYNRANTVMNRTLQQALTPLGAVMVPVLSRLRGDRARFNGWLRNLALLVVGLGAPCAALLMASSRQIVEILLGPDWLPAVPILWWLSLGAFVIPFGSLLYWAVVVTGNVRLLLFWTWSGSLVSIVAILVGLSWGALGVAVGFGVGGLTVRALLAFYCVSKSREVDAAALGGIYMAGILVLSAMLALLSGCERLFSAWFSNVFGQLAATGLTAVMCMLLLAVGTASGRRIVGVLRSELMPMLRWKMAGSSSA